MFARNRTMLLKFIALLGDVMIFYLALCLSLLVRNGGIALSALLEHLPAFSLLLFAWILFGYLSGIYELEVFINNRLFAFRLNRLLLVQALAMLVAFYFLPFLNIEPRFIFLIFILAFSILVYIWRSIFNGMASSLKNSKRIILVSSLARSKELIDLINSNPQFGFRLERHIENPVFDSLPEKGSVDVVLSSSAFLKDSLLKSHFSDGDGPAVVPVLEFYRSVVRFLPVEEFSYHNELHGGAGENEFLSGLKRFVEFLLSALLLILFSPFFLLIALAIMLDSEGSVFYKQVRAGKDGKPFTLYKFRSMSSDLSVNPDDLGGSPTWSSGASDKRVTTVGKFLRATHLDELAQLINIFKGDMSFIGPRPERPEIDKNLMAEIPHYQMRYLMKPGVTGWAQINYPYVSSVEQAKSRLEYDLYYLFERSLLLDARIILKTFRHFFIRN